MEWICRENSLNIPNLLTLIRILLLPAVVWCFRAGYSLGALALYVAAMLTDVLDGVFARKFNQITVLGKLLDPVADKLSLLILLWMFVADGQISVWLLNFVLIKELILVIGGTVALQQGIVVQALPIGKATTLTFVFSMIARFLSWRVLADGLLAVSLMLSMIALVWYSVVLMNKIRDSGMKKIMQAKVT